jgi:hypothetical protein
MDKLIRVELAAAFVQCLEVANFVRTDEISPELRTTVMETAVRHPVDMVNEYETFWDDIGNRAIFQRFRHPGPTFRGILPGVPDVT